MSPIRHPITLATPAVPRLVLRRENTALLVQDMQRWMVDPGLGLGAVAHKRGVFREFQDYYEQVEELLPRITQLVASCRLLGIPVVFTRWACETEQPASLVQRSMGMRLAEDDPAVALHGSFEPLPADVIVAKTGLSAFSNRRLDEQLDVLGIENLLITGAMSEFGVHATAFGAMDLGYRPLVVSDACAGVTRETHGQVMSGLTFATMKTRNTWEILRDLSVLETEDVVLI